MRFPEFFAAIHGHEPFPWQARLAESVGQGDWPALVDIPTGGGKTALLDIATWGALYKAGPRSIVYVVDRRLIVDQVSERARKLEEWASEIQMTELRGGLHGDEPSPRLDRIQITVSTVDQVGSRLLFRGYGLSPRSRSIYAGVLGTNSVFIVDEAHLSQPFLETLGSIQRLHLRKIGEPPRVVELTATPREQKAFSLTPEDKSHPILKPRISASKIAVLDSVKNRDMLEAHLVQKALRHQSGVVAVVVNRVDTARAVHDHIEALGEEAVLLIGRIRPIDRDRLVEEFLPRLRVGRERSEERLFVVSTQTIEVGADLDFDALVTEAAPLSSLRQRFGRLDRLGQLGTSWADVVLCKESSTKDPIYGNGIGDTWKWLSEAATRKQIDFGTTSMAAALEKVPAPLTIEEHADPLVQPILDHLVQTHPEAFPPLDLTSFLHGPSRSADVSIVWRQDLLPGDEEHWPTIAGMLPPRVRESMQVPIWAARQWLCGQPSAVADVEGAFLQSEKSLEGRSALRWLGEDSKVVSPAELRVGDSILVPAVYGGADRFGWVPTSQEVVADVAEEAYLEEGTRVERTEKVPEGNGGTWLPYPEASLVTGWLLISRPAKGRGGARDAETLSSHTERVVDWVEAFSTHLAPELRNDLILAAKWHDEGKRDPRFQVLLHAGDEISAAMAKEPLAKSGMEPHDVEAARRARRLSGLPKGWRHELESVALATLGSANDPELVRHLIGSHHGHGRPLVPDQLDPVDWSNQFWRLCREYGWWGLAFLEAVLRLADWHASARTESSRAKPGRFAERES